MVKHVHTIAKYHTDSVNVIIKKYKIKSIQGIIEKCRSLLDKMKPTYLIDSNKFEDEALERFNHMSYDELKKAITKYKTIIDMMNELLYRKNSKVASYKKTINVLNKLQSQLNEELVL